MKNLKKWLSKRKPLLQKAEDRQSDTSLEPYVKKEPISGDLQQVKQRLKEVFAHCSDIVFRDVQVYESVKGFVIFADGIVKPEEIHQFLLEPLLNMLPFEKGEITPKRLEENQIPLTQMSKAHSYAEIVELVLTGNAVLLIEGSETALAANVIGGTRRGVEEPTTEAVIRGPREGFTENLRTNTALVRFRLKTPRLKMVAYQIGDLTRTNVVLAYVDGVVDPRVIEEVKRRLDSVKIDGVLESGYIEELIEDEPFSPFPQFQNTERPDTIVAHLLEGRFAIFVDGTPFVLVAPVSVWSMLQSSEDYYERYFIGSFLRVLRLIFVGIALFLPALYVAISTFHQDMLPTTLLLSVAAARESIPFPAIVEALIMELSFEALREAGVRLPKTVGQAVSILGALVIGQAAVQAGIVSAPMVIIVAVTGIASFTIPRFNFAVAIRLLRFPLMFLGASLGLYGMVLGTLWIVTHLCKLRSFGFPYLSGVAPLQPDGLKDLFIRVPWWRMLVRPSALYNRNRKRMPKGMKPGPKS